MPLPIRCLRPIFAIVLLLPLAALGQAGRFILAAGEVSVARGGQTIAALQGMAVQPGDTITVGSNSNAQLRFSDEGIVSLRSQTVFRVDEYTFTGQADGTEKGVFSLLKGGLRTVTGLIGRQRRDAYLVRTPTATVGIRGTHYVLVHCDNDCAQPGGRADAGNLLAQATLAQSDAGSPGLGGPSPNGTYGGVPDGRIEVRNEAGQGEFGRDEYFFVANAKTPPVNLIGPPSFLHDRLEGQSRSRGSKSSSSTESAPGQSGAGADGRANESPQPPPRNEFVATEQRNADGTLAVTGLGPGFAPGRFNGLAALSATSVPHAPGAPGAQHTAECDDTGACAGGPGTVVTFDALGYKRIDSGPGGFIDRASATNTEVGSVPGVIEWGKWTGGPIQAGGFYNNLNFGNNQGLNYVVGVPASPMPTSGMGSFSLLGATRPTFSDGVGGGLGTGSMTSGTATANFLTGSVTANMTLAFPNGNYALAMTSGSIRSGTAALSGSGNLTFSGGSVNVCGSPCAASFVGFFAGPNATHLGLGYDANAGVFYINGVAVMKR